MTITEDEFRAKLQAEQEAQECATAQEKYRELKLPDFDTFLVNEENGVDGTVNRTFTPFAAAWRRLAASFTKDALGNAARTEPVLPIDIGPCQRPVTGYARVEPPAVSYAFPTVSAEVCRVDEVTPTEHIISVDRGLNYEVAMANRRAEHYFRTQELLHSAKPIRLHASPELLAAMRAEWEAQEG